MASLTCPAGRSSALACRADSVSARAGTTGYCQQYIQSGSRYSRSRFALCAGSRRVFAIKRQMRGHAFAGKAVLGWRKVWCRSWHREARKTAGNSDWRRVNAQAEGPSTAGALWGKMRRFSFADNERFNANGCLCNLHAPVKMCAYLFIAILLLSCIPKHPAAWALVRIAACRACFRTSPCTALALAAMLLRCVRPVQLTHG